MSIHLHKKYKPLIISGCSGVGKGTLITNLLQYFPQLFQLSVSYTTRMIRQGQIKGKHYNYISRNQFLKLLKQEIFLQNCQVHGNLYGTSRIQVQKIINKGKICLLDIDIQGAEKINKQFYQWNYLFIQPPSLEELQIRLRGRGTEGEESIKKRMTNARKELDRVKQVGFYERLVNDKMEECYRVFIKYINTKYQLLIQIQK